MDFRNIKRVTVFAGHYGSGKTNVAVNYALNIKNLRETHIADLDIVNPYFRTKDAEKILADNGIRLISSAYANTNVDTPAIAPETYEIIHNKNINAVVDVGGDDRGALALGRYAPGIIEENDYDMLFVINKYRYLTSDLASAVEVMKEIEGASSMKFTGIVNNSNLGAETDEDTVKGTFEYARQISEYTGLDIKFTTVREDLAECFRDYKNIMPIKIYVKQDWIRE